MDLKTAKELDNVLNILKEKITVDFQIELIRDSTDRIHTFPLIDYIKHIERLDYITQLGNSKYTITFKGKTFNGFENELRSQEHEMNKARSNEWLVSRGAIFAAIFSGLLIVLELIKFGYQIDNDKKKCCHCERIQKEK